MKKIRLDADALNVESFPVTADQTRRGTVVGKQSDWGDCVWTDPRYGGCVYPTAAHHSCEPGQTDDENTCNCLYPDTDAQICCTGQGCSGMC